MRNQFRADRARCAQPHEGVLRTLHLGLINSHFCPEGLMISAILLAKTSIATHGAKLTPKRRNDLRHHVQNTQMQNSINPEPQHHFAHRDQKQPSKTSNLASCSFRKLQLSTARFAGSLTVTLLVEVYKHKTHKLRQWPNHLLYPYVQIDIVHKRSPTHLHSPLSTRRGRAASRRLSLGRLHRPGPSTFYSLSLRRGPG
jgi:hypothetical protein